MAVFLVIDGSSKLEKSKSPYIPLCKGGLRGISPNDSACERV